MALLPFHMYQELLEKIEALGLIRENNTRTDSLQQLVADVIQEFKRGQNPLVISPIHREGKAFAQSLRARMRTEGMLGQEDHEVAWLEGVDLSAARIAQARLDLGGAVQLARSLGAVVE